MTIVFFARYFYPHIGGVEKHVAEVGERLVEKGHRVIVISENPQIPHSNTKQSKITSATPTGKAKTIESYNIEAGNEGFLKKFRVWKQLWGYRKLIKEADIAHCHDVFFWYLPFRFLYPSKKVYTTFHGYEGNTIPGKKAKAMHKLSEKLSKGNICIGKFLEKWYGTKATYVSYGATETLKHKTENLNKEWSKGSMSNKIVFLGRLEEETSIMKYLKAFKIITKKYPKLKLTVLGDGALRGKAEEFVKENGLNVEFKGFITNTDEFLLGTNFVFTSRYLGILESLAGKNYVLSTYNSLIMKDYLTDTPFKDYIFIAPDAEGIANDFVKHFEDIKLTAAITEKGFKWAKEQTWDKMTETYLSLWSKPV